MIVTRGENISHIKYKSHQLINSMLSPFCGLNQEIGYVSRTNGDMRLLVGSAALTGIHVLFNRPNPGRGAYHIGGTGIFPNESIIRILGETVERYAQLMSDFSFSAQMKFEAYKNLKDKDENTLSKAHWSFYSNEQLSRPGFPFASAKEDDHLSWIRMFSCLDNAPILVPAQLVLVGYELRKSEGEPWITSAVTTGTAAHVNYPQALKAALLELIQLDSVMGHWYSSWKAYQIEFDGRLSSLTALMTRYNSGSLHQYKFYYIPNPDLLGFTIACLYLQDRGLPKVVIGLGADLSLENAMYKAFLETVASVGLARMVVFKGKYELGKHNNPMDSSSLYDLDRNVEYYGAGNNLDRIKERFIDMSSIKASDIQQDIEGNHESQVATLIASFRKSNKNIYFLNLSGAEEEALGFKVMRVWSPNTLSLCLPSAPQLAHSRFNEYGGISHEDPHPYP